MAIRQKYSRKITVGGDCYRWHLASDDYFDFSKKVIVLAEGNRNGAQLLAVLETEPVTPALVRRLIEAGLSQGWDPRAGASQSLKLAPELVRRALFCYPHGISWQGRHYCWLPDLTGGLHLKIWSATIEGGQLLAAGDSLGEKDLTEQVAAAFIGAALAQGWQPQVSGLDCFWLDPAIAAEVLKNR